MPDLTNNETRTPCPPWCTLPSGHKLFHASVIGRFGAVLGISASVDVGQLTDEHEPTVNVWSQDYTADASTEVVRLTPAEAATLARVLGAIDDFGRFRHALTEAARVLDGQGDEAVTS